MSIGMTCALPVSCSSTQNVTVGVKGVNPKIRKKAMWMLVLYGIFVSLAITSPQIASAENSLTDLFSTTAFTGSWKVFSSVNFVGKFLNTAISLFCLFGLVGVVFRVVLTLLYKSSENLFDRVHELKEVGRGTKFFGIPAIGKELASGNYGVGADVIIGFFLSLCPDFKAYSDYNPDKMAYNLKEDDTVTTYILKISLPTIMTIFFFSIGWNGTLWKAYANVVDAMAIVAERAASVDLSNYVNKALNAGSYYAFKSDDTEYGNFLLAIKKDLYNDLLRRMDSIDSASMLKVGSLVESKINEIKAEEIDSKVGNDGMYSKRIQDDESAVKNLTFTSTINYNEIGDVGKGSYVKEFPVSDCGVSMPSVSGKTAYASIVVHKKANADETQYFKINDDSTGGEAPTMHEGELK